jgi:hypothetical protein
MRLPSGLLRDLAPVFIGARRYCVLGCLSFEERCFSAPFALNHINCAGMTLLEIVDPEDGHPNFRSEILDKTTRWANLLDNVGVRYVRRVADLLAEDDDLLVILSEVYRAYTDVDTLVLDISSMPKRFFCYFLRKLLEGQHFTNVIITCTAAGAPGYPEHKLAFDATTSDLLPGFLAPPPPRGSTLVLAIGFEALNIPSVFQNYSDKKIGSKIILSFPPNGRNCQRQWNTIKELKIDPRILRDHTEVVAAWDAETVYELLCDWDNGSDGLTMAPFGPKQHTLAMALFAICNDCGMFYSQPMSYHPDYTIGSGDIYAYVVNWDNVPCYKRPSD